MTHVFIKAGLVLTYTITSIIYCYFQNENQEDNIEDIDDKLHNFTETINIYFREHVLERNIMLIIGSALLDIMIITQGIRMVI